MARTYYRAAARDLPRTAHIKRLGTLLLAIEIIGVSIVLYHLINY